MCPVIGTDEEEEELAVYDLEGAEPAPPIAEEEERGMGLAKAAGVVL